MSDLISRQAAIDAFERFIHELGIKDEPYNYGEMALSAQNVPSAEPEKCGDCISRESALEILDDYAEDIESGNWGTAYSKARTSMCALSSVDPERKKGHWIIHSDDLFPSESTQECSECHEHQSLDWRHSDNYCPNCGADMRGVQDGTG